MLQNVRICPSWVNRPPWTMMANAYCRAFWIVYASPLGPLPQQAAVRQAFFACLMCCFVNWRWKSAGQLNGDEISSYQKMRWFPPSISSTRPRRFGIRSLWTLCEFPMNWILRAREKHRQPRACWSEGKAKWAFFVISGEWVTISALNSLWQRIYDSTKRALTAEIDV
jgi:hypothetical protein